MTGIVTGAGLGLYGNALNVLGNATLGANGNRVYVNSTTGNLIVQQQDEYLASVGLDLGLSRTYNSLGVLDGDNNDNWRLSLHRRVYNLTGTANTANSTITKTFGDGFDAIYIYDTSRSLYVSSTGDGAHDTLSYNSTSQVWTWTDGSAGAKEEYQSDGAGGWRLWHTLDADGNTTTYNYNLTSKLLESVVDANGQITTLTWTGTDLTQIAVTSNTLTTSTTRYFYDASHRLTQVVVDLNLVDGFVLQDTRNNSTGLIGADGIYDSVNGATYVTSYTYDGTSKRIASITSGDGTTVSFTYDASGRIATYREGTAPVVSFGYSAQTTTVTDALSHVTTYVRDANNRVSRVYANGSAGTRLTTAYLYDAQDNITQVISGREDEVSTYLDNPVSATATGLRTLQITYNQYDSRSNRTQSQDLLGNTVSAAYDTTNPDISLLLGETRTANGTALTTHYVYTNDSEHHLRFSIAPEGRVSEYRYNTNGTLASTIAYAGGLYTNTTYTEQALNTWVSTQDKTKTQRTDTAYDFRGQVQTVSIYGNVDASGNGVADSQRSINYFVYDQRGRLLQTIDARATGITLSNTNPRPLANTTTYATTYTYDGMGRLLTSVQYIGTGQTRTTSTTQYDDVGNRIITTAANGLTSTSVYDKRGLLQSVTNSAPDATPLGTTTYKYDADGKLRYTIDPIGRRTYMVYDAQDRVVAAINAAGELTETIYNDAGEVSQVKAYANRLTTAQLTLHNTDVTINGQVFAANVDISQVRPVADANNDRVTRTFYDKAGRVVMLIVPTDTDATRGYVTQKFYDGAGRVTDVAQYVTPVNLATLPANAIADDVVVTANTDDRHTRIFYSNDGLNQGTLDGEGYLTENTYDAAGRLTKSTVFYNVTASSLRNNGTFAQLKASITTNAQDKSAYTFYNAKGQVIGQLSSAGYLTTTGYTLTGQVNEQRSYDAVINYNGTGTLASITPNSASSLSHWAVNAYDDQKRLQSTTSYQGNSSANTSTKTEFEYDNVGYVIRATRGINTSDVRTLRTQYDAAGRIIAELSAEGSEQLNNLNGRTVQDIWNTCAIHHTYNAAGQRIKSIAKNGQTTWYFYDDAGRVKVSIQSADGGLNSSGATITNQGEVSLLTYNSFGQVVDTTNLNQRITTTGLTGGAYSSIEATVNTLIDTNASITHVNYTLRGAVREAIDAMGYRSQATYNAFGEVQTTQREITTNVFGLNQTYTHDHRGLTTQVTETGRTSSTSYDAFGRVTDVYLNGVRQQHIDYSKDGTGRQIVTTTDVLNFTNATTYDAFGRTLSIRDKNGQTYSYNYNDTTRSITITTPEGITTTTTRSAHGETVQVKDGNGNNTTYTYNKDGQLTDTYVDPTSLNPSGLNLYTRTTYDNSGRVYETTDANGVITRFSYDAANRVITRTLDPSGLNITTQSRYDAKGNQWQMTDANGVVTTNTFDKNGRVTDVAIDPTGLNLRTHYTYDGVGNTLTVTQGVGTDDVRTTEYRYDALNRRIADIKDPDVGRLNITTSYVYDAKNNLVAKTEGDGTSEARTTRFVYNLNDQVVYTIDALGGITKQSYDNNGNVVLTTEYTNAIDLVGLGYNATITIIAARIVVNDTADRVTRYAYDKNNRLIYTCDALNQLTQRVYDKNNNVIQVIAFATAVSNATANSNSKSIYDTAVVSLANSSLDRTTSTVYDAANRAVFSVDALNYVGEVQYDKVGNMIKTTQYAKAITPPAALTVASIRAAIVVDTNNDRSTLAVYDAAGRARFAIDALGYVKETRYDNIGHITDSMGYYDAINTANLPASPSLTDIESALGTRSNTHPAQDQITHYDYDAAGRLRSTTDAEGFTEYYGYDAVGNKINFTNKKGLDQGDPAYTWTYQYDKLGRLTRETTPSVDVYRMQTDAQGNPVLDVNGQPVILKSTEPVITNITYDALGNVKTRVEAYGAPEQRTTTYVYDNLGRQTQTIFPPVGVYDVSRDNVSNTGLIQSQTSNVFNNAWSLNAGTNTLLATTGMSIDISQMKDGSGSPLYHADSTPTVVTATVYRSDGTLVATVATEVGSYYDDGYGNYIWSAVSGWNGKVNLSFSTLPTDTYHVDLLIKDEADVLATASNIYYDGVDGVWTRVGSVSVSVGTTNNSALRVETTQTLSTTTTYDRFNNGTVNKDVSGSYSYKVYDQFSRVKYEIDVEHYVTEYKYDPFGNQVSLTRYATGISFANHSDLNAAFTQTEVAGLLAQQTGNQHALDRSITNIYDKLNRATETRQPAVYNYDSSSTVNPYFTASPTTRNEYNAFGQMIRQRTLVNSGDNTWADVYIYFDRLGHQVAQINALGYITTFTYDAKGNLTQQMEYAKALAAGTWNDQGYANPLVTTATDANSTSDIGFDRVTKYAYDNLNRKVSDTKVNVQYTDANYSGMATLTSQLGNLTTSYGYDPLDNVVSMTDPESNMRFTYYDALGRTVAVTEPTRLTTTGGIPALPTLTIEQTALTTSFASTLVFGSWQQSITVGWESLEQWGDGDVTVEVTYTEATAFNSTRKRSVKLDSKHGLYGTTFSWVESSLLSNRITGVTRIKVTKVVDGKNITVTDDTANSHPNVAIFEKPSLSSTIVELRVRPVGSTTDWTTINPSILLERGDAWGLDLSNLSKFTPGNGYEYQLSYKQTASANAYFIGTGSFTIPDTVKSFVDARSLTATVASNKATLRWNGLADWGSGNVKVTLGYSYVASGKTYSTTALPQVVGDVFGFNGTVFALVGNSQVVTSILVQKQVNGEWVSIYNQYGTGIPPNRLILQGDTSNVTGIAIDGVAGTFAAIAIGGGYLAVDVSSLARGNYSYHIIRNAVTETIARSLEIKSGSVAGPTVVQEIYGYDDTSGNFVSRLEVANMPSTIFNFVFKFSTSDSGPFISKTVTATSLAGIFTIFDQDMPNGTYRYRLEDGYGNLLNVTGSTGVFTVKRGAQSVAVPNGTFQTPVTPLTTMSRDIFGNIVRQKRFANGALSAGVAGFDESASHTDDQLSYMQYDNFGHVLRSIDAEGKSSHYSYNAAGQVVKEWQLATNADGFGHYVIKQYNYDKLGQQINTIQGLQDGGLLRNEAQYDAFGSIVKKGTDGGWQEYFEYDVAGRLWRTNQEDGITKVYLYNLQGQATAVIKSQGRDLANSAIYHNATDVAVLTTDIERTNTLYDRLGRPVRQVQPSFNPYIDEMATTLVLANSFLNVGQPIDDGSGGFTLQLDWSSLNLWGAGDITVQLEYAGTDASGVTTPFTAQQSFNAYDAMQGVSFTFTVDTAYTFSGITAVTVSKQVNDQDVVLLTSSGSDAMASTLYWLAPGVDGLRAALQYRPVGSSGAWTQVSSDDAILSNGGFYSLDVSLLLNDQYEYQLSYTRPGESTPYITGTGNLTITGHGSVGSLHGASWVEEPVLNVVSTTLNGGKTLYSTVLDWSSLESWGGGDVTVTMNYTLRNSSNVQYTTSVTKTFDGFDAMRGATATFPYNASYPTFVSLNSISVVKSVSGQNVTVLQSPNGTDAVMPERLILQGNLSGLTGVNLYNAQGGLLDARTLANGKMVNLGNSCFAVDISNLPRGSYSYATLGTASIDRGIFESRGTGGANSIVLQESSSYINFTTVGSTTNIEWTPLTGLGNGDITVNIEYGTNFFSKTCSASDALHGVSIAQLFAGISRVTVTKKIDGQDVIVRITNPGTGTDSFTSNIEISGLPTDTGSVNVEYRPLGSIEPYQVKTATPMLSLWQVSNPLGNTLNGQNTYNSSYQFVGDFNGDKKADYMWYANGWWVAISNGNGFDTSSQWLGTTLADGSATTNSANQFVADMNGDGKCDYIWRNAKGWQVALANSTSNGFITPTAAWLANTAIVTGNGAAAIATYNNSYQFIADVNGDKNADYLWYNNGWNVAISTGSGFQAPVKWMGTALADASATTDPNYQFMSDMNGDGKADYVWKNAKGWQVAISNGTGFTVNKWLANTLADGSLSYNSTYQAFADINGDGKTDYIWKNANGWQVALSTGTGFQNPAQWLGLTLADGSTTYNPSTTSIVVNDFTGDGKADYLWYDGNSFHLARSTGTGFELVNDTPLFNTLGDGSATINSSYHFFADFNGDGKADYLWMNANGWQLAKANLRTWFALDTSDMQNGQYEYRLTIKDINGKLLDLTTLGGTSNGIFTGTTNLGHGGISQPFSSVSNAIVTPVVTQTLDRWGNVLASTDPRNSTWVTRNRYNYLNQAIDQVQPQVTSVDEHGVATPLAPETSYYYDSLGRQIAVKDALGHVNAYQYDNVGQRITEVHADGAQVQYIYDVLGRQIAVVDGNGNRTDNTYDRNNRLTKRRNMLGETESYTYDEQGHRITVTDATLYTTRYYYDDRGTVVRSQLPGGQDAFSAYDQWGHKVRESHSGTTDYTSWSYDYFGKLIGHTDLGAASYQYRYDYANHLLQQTNSRGQNLNYYYYANGQLKRSVDRGVAQGNLSAVYSESVYSYDAAGHRTREVYREYGTPSTGFKYYQNAATAYDALGRMATYSDLNTQVSYSYDALGNRRHTQATYFDPSNADADVQTADYWYLYDAMNRITLSQGTLLNGQITLAETSIADGFNDKATWASATTLGGDPNRQQFVDINGDGKADWVTFPTTGGVQVFLYQFDPVSATSGFASIPAFTGLTSVITDPARVKLIDMTGDGKKDIVYFPSTGGMQVYLNQSNVQTGAVSFASTAVFTGLSSIGSDVSRVQLVDVNGDGMMDVVYNPPSTNTAQPGGLQVFLNKGVKSNNTVSFVNTPDWSGLTGLGSTTSFFRLVDVNGDGRIDLVYTPPNLQAQVYLNNNNNGFNLVTNWNGPMKVSDPNRLHFADTNGDGKLDWVYISGGTRVAVYLNTGSGRFTVNPVVSLLKTSSGTSAGHYRVEDTNADGIADLVHIKGSGGAELFVGNGKGGFSVKSRWGIYYAGKPAWSGLKGIGVLPGQQKLVDVNGDGYLDWIYINAVTGGTSLYMHGEAQGAQLSYDGASNRRVASSFDDQGKRFTEYYAYDYANRITSTYRLSQVVDSKTGQFITRQDYTSERLYDAAGRVVIYKTYSAPGVLATRQENTYNENGWVKKQKNLDKNNKEVYFIDRSMAGAYADDGRALTYKVKTPSFTNTFDTTYIAFESYKELKVNGSSNYFSSGRTNLSYDVNGNLVKVTDATDKTKFRSFVNNAQGQILLKKDYKGKQQYYYYANGMPIGSSGALTGADFDFNYTPVSDSYPSTVPSQYTVNVGDTMQMVAMAVYGDAKLWYLIADANGLDASSTLTAGMTLTIPNQISNIHNDSTTFKTYNPSEIIGDTTPNLPDPPPPAGGGCGVIGMIIMVIVAIVVTIFTAGAGAMLMGAAMQGGIMATGLAAMSGGLAAATVTAGTLAAAIGTTAVGIAASMVGAAVGSIASQLTGKATGNVTEFSWAAVATSALTAGITSGVGAAFGSTGGIAKNVFNVSDKYIGAGINNMVNNTINQGINIATGQQKQFNWASWAMAGVSAAGMSYLKDTGLGKEFGQTTVGKFVGFGPSTDTGKFSVSKVATDTLKTFATSYITQAVSSKGKVEWQPILANAFGNALGNSIVEHTIYQSKVEIPAQQLKDKYDEFNKYRELKDSTDPEDQKRYAEWRIKLQAHDSELFDKEAVKTQTKIQMSDTMVAEADTEQDNFKIQKKNDETTKVAWVSGKYESPNVHGASIDRLDIPDNEKVILKLATDVVDKLQGAEESLMHAMSTTKLQLTSSEQRDLANDWVRFNLMQAYEYKAAGDTNLALFHVGVAMHDVQDYTSPAHGFDKNWDGFNFSFKSISEGFKHVFSEWRDPGPGSNLDRTSQDIYRMYQENRVRMGDIFAPYGKDNIERKEGISAPNGGYAQA
jgi:YD repeat-containing protein